MTKPASEQAASPKERRTITIDLTEHPKLWEHITKKAAEDERTPAAWTRRYLDAKLGTSDAPMLFEAVQR